MENPGVVGISGGRGVVAAPASVVDELVGRLPSVSGIARSLRAVDQRVAFKGDLFDMLKLPDLPTPFEPQEVTIRRVVDGDTGEPMEPDADAPRVNEDASLSELIQLAIDADAPIVVVDDGVEVGVITRPDILQTVIEGAETS